MWLLFVRMWRQRVQKHSQRSVNNTKSLEYPGNTEFRNLLWNAADHSTISRISFGEPTAVVQPTEWHTKQRKRATHALYNNTAGWFVRFEAVLHSARLQSKTLAGIPVQHWALLSCWACVWNVCTTTWKQFMTIWYSLYISHFEICFKVHSIFVLFTLYLSLSAFTFVVLHSVAICLDCVATAHALRFGC